MNDQIYGRQDETDRLIKTLRYSLGASAFVAGLDKFFNLLTDWEKYLSPTAKKKMPVNERTLIRTVGVIEMAAGVGLLAGFEEAMGYTIGAWMLAITGNLLLRGKYYDVAVRDTNMALEAFVLARLAGMKKKSEAMAEAEEEPSFPQFSAREVLESSELTRIAS